MHTNTVEHLTKKLKQKISNIYLGIRLRTKELWIWILLQSIVFQIWHLFRVEVQATSEWIITQSILCGMTKYTFSKYLVLVLCYNRVQRQIWVLILSKFVRINFYYPWNQKKSISFLTISRGIDTFSWMFWSKIQCLRRPAIKHITELYEFRHGRFSGNFLKISKGSFSRACAKKIL